MVFSRTHFVAMIYLGLLLLPSGYFFSRRRWGGLVGNGLVSSLALFIAFFQKDLLLASFVWLLAVGHASLAFHKEARDEYAKISRTENRG